MANQERIKIYIGMIDSGIKDLTNRDIFFWVIQESVSVLNLTNANLADELDVSRSTIERWIKQKNAPYHELRPFVYKRLRDLATKC